MPPELTSGQRTVDWGATWHEYHVDGGVRFGEKQSRGAGVGGDLAPGPGPTPRGGRRGSPRAAARSAHPAGSHAPKSAGAFVSPGATKQNTATGRPRATTRIASGGGCEPKAGGPAGPRPGGPRGHVLRGPRGRTPPRPLPALVSPATLVPPTWRSSPRPALAACVQAPSVRTRSCWTGAHPSDLTRTHSVRTLFQHGHVQQHLGSGLQRDFLG